MTYMNRDQRLVVLKTLRASASKQSKKFMKNSMTRIEKQEMMMNVMRNSSNIND